MMVMEIRAKEFLCPIQQRDYIYCSGKKCMMWVSRGHGNSVGGCGLVNRR